MFNFDLLFGDYMAKVSDQAKLYYIKLCFFANNGFVANPISVLDSMGYDKGVFYELLNSGELLKLPDRSEVFITSYFVHNHFNPKSWLKTPFAVYWKGKLWTKKNGMATFKPQKDEDEPEFVDELEAVLPPQKEEEPKKTLDDFTEEEWAKLSPEEQQKILNDSLPY